MITIMKNLLRYIILPVVSVVLCCFQDLCSIALGIILLLVVQIINWIHSCKQNKEIRKLRSYDKTFQTKYNDKGEITDITIDGGTF